MRTLTATVIGIGLCFAATNVNGKFFSKNQLPKVETIEVSVQVDVADDCLNDNGTLQTQAELVLRRSGITVKRSDDAHVLGINIIGYYSNAGVCVADIDAQLWKFERLTNGSSGLVEAATLGSLLSGPKQDFTSQVRDAVDELTSELANEILKARQN